MEFSSCTDEFEFVLEPFLPQRHLFSHSFPCPPLLSSLALSVFLLFPFFCLFLFNFFTSLFIHPFQTWTEVHQQCGPECLVTCVTKNATCVTHEVTCCFFSPARKVKVQEVNTINSRAHSFLCRCLRWTAGGLLQHQGPMIPHWLPTIEVSGCWKPQLPQVLGIEVHHMIYI